MILRQTAGTLHLAGAQNQLQSLQAAPTPLLEHLLHTHPNPRDTVTMFHTHRDPRDTDNHSTQMKPFSTMSWSALTKHRLCSRD